VKASCGGKLTVTSLTIWFHGEQAGSSGSGLGGSTLLMEDPAWLVGVKLAWLVGVKVASLVLVNLPSLGASW